MPERVEHTAYPSLVDDPLATVERVFAASGIAVDEDIASRVESFLHAQRSGTRAAPPRELATLAYDHDEVLSHPVVGDYCRMFGILPERSRLTGAQPPA